MVLFAPLVPRAIRTLGAVPVMVGSLVINAATILLLAAFRDIVAWFALRVVMGVTIGALFAVSEAWVNQVAAGEARGRTVSIYIIVVTAGLASGPLVIPLVGIEGWTPFVVAFALVILAALPLMWAWPLAPAFGTAPSIGVWAFLRAAPRLMAAVGVVGIFFGTIEPLLPVYGVKVGMALTGAVAMLSVVVIGNMVLLYPIGWLADRFAPGPIMVLCGAVLLGGASALPFVIDIPTLLWPVLLIWGGGAGRIVRAGHDRPGPPLFGHRLGRRRRRVHDVLRYRQYRRPRARRPGDGAMGADWPADRSRRRLPGLRDPGRGARDRPDGPRRMS